MTTLEKTKTVKTGRRTVRVIGKVSFDPAVGHTTFLLNGQIQPVDNVVEVSESEARELIARGLVVDATEAEVAAAGAVIAVAPVSEHATWTDAA